MTRLVVVKAVGLWQLSPEGAFKMGSNHARFGGAATVVTRVGAFIIVAGLYGACAVRTTPNASYSENERVASLFLIGDAGKATVTDPVLNELISDAKRAPRDRAVVFLGDNIYPSGLPSAAPGNSVIEQRHLDAQIAVARQSRTETIFVPGNHDWARMGSDGWRRIQESEKFIAARGEGRARQLPTGGCPGPDSMDVGQSIRLLFIDTQWWLHKASHPKPPDHGSNCRASSEKEVLEMLTAALRGAAADGRHAVVAAHHPLDTAGPHGSRFPLLSHLFPLRDLKKYLWIPLPLIGSLVQNSRRELTSQDLFNDKNVAMREGFEAAMGASPPLVFAAGHEHSLQIFRGPTARFSVVSGAGTLDHQTKVGWKPSTLYASSKAGYMRMDVLANGAVRLAVIEVTASEVREAASLWLIQPTGR